MNIANEKKFVEAIKRMKRFGIIEDAVKQFVEDKIVMCTDSRKEALFCLDYGQKKLVRKFEEENDAVVYMVVRSYASFGPMDSFLYVSDYEDEWEYDNDDICNRCPMTYTYNYGAPAFSQFERIGVRSALGGLVRTT